MLIQQNYSAYNNKYNFKPDVKPQNNIGFSGHANVENCIRKGFKKLVQQTSMGRELQTKMFVTDYIKNNLSDKNSIKIVSAGCSSGEEAVTWSMLLYCMKNKVDILGIDLGRNAIKQANSRKYIFHVPKKNINLLDYFNTISASPYTDTFLVTKDYSGLTPDQRHLASLFEEFFEPGKKIRTPLSDRFHYQIMRSMGIEPLVEERFEYKLKDGMAENCHFKCADVKDIDKVLGKEKADVISFCNALYHLTVTDPTSTERIPLKNSKQIVEELMTKFKNSLNDNGLVVFGESEGAQMGDYVTVPRVMKKLGFIPMNKTENHPANVWKKG